MEPVLYICSYHSVPSGPPPPIKLVLDEYDFKHPRRGKAIIINQKNFHPTTGQNKRDGTDVSKYICSLQLARKHMLSLYVPDFRKTRKNYTFISIGAVSGKVMCRVRQQTLG